MTNGENIRLGFVGAGTMGLLHMETFGRITGVEMKAVADVSAIRAQAAATDYGLERAYTDSLELIEAPDIDAIVISVPNAFHAELACSALRAGKHVLLEKPMAMNAEEARQVLHAEKESGKTLMIGHQMRWKWPFPEVKRQIAEGKLGQIYYVKTGWLRRKGIPGWGSAYTSQAMMGGGSAVDIGVHMLDIALYLCSSSKPVGVYGASFGEIGKQRKGMGTWGIPNLAGKFDVDDLAVAMIRMEDGAVIHLEVSWAAFTDGEENGPYVHLMGNQGGVSIRDSGSHWMTECFDDSVDIPVAGAEERGDERLNLAEHFLHCVRTGSTPITDGRSGFVNQTIIDALYLSSKTGKEVQLEL
ncbi:Gfo/Idh/MocA family protein [Cohnella abietis]|uniref:Oxidoreductase n=1 Tax=Cohnella abietis TaxID=2507935 RepID=A0A3T1D402_9BACL|nr:Gfo/Idh/MocA family oxidoreductase [Cohnella abietis]BBI32840.1 oxidoreductase [Cohnella abietis]